MHMVETMAYVGQKPWHGLGNKLARQQSIEVWKQQAGMDWQIEESEVRYVTGSHNIGTINAFPENKVLYRSDTKKALAVVSKRFQVVQPGEILEFYRDLTADNGFELETAGVLREGRKFWALARTGQSTTLRGRDRVEGYLLLATACDGTLATTAQFTSVRVVCNNTLQMALRDSTGAIKVPHSTQFDAVAVKEALGLGLSHWDEFKAQTKALIQRPVAPEEALRFFSDLLAQPLDADNQIILTRPIQQLHELYQGAGMGSDLASSRNSAWGLVNAVTEYVDHHRRARSQDYRLDSAWFGQGSQLKSRALNQALTLLQ